MSCWFIERVVPGWPHAWLNVDAKLGQNMWTTDPNLATKYDSHAAAAETITGLCITHAEPTEHQFI